MIKFTGERIVPGSDSCEPLFAQKMFQEHIARYLFAAQLARGRNVLDVGCGVGYGSQALALNGAARVVAFDVAPVAIEHAAANYAHPSLEFHVANAENFRFPERFGLITCFELIEHVQNPQSVLQSCFEHLEEDGFLVISTPRSLGVARSAFHVREFTGFEFKALLSVHFPQLAWFVENNHFCSIVTPGPPRSLPRISTMHDQYSAGMSDYLVAVASRRPLDMFLEPQIVINDDQYVLNLEKDVSILHQAEDGLRDRCQALEFQLASLQEEHRASLGRVKAAELHSREVTDPSDSLEERLGTAQQELSGLQSTLVNHRRTNAELRTRLAQAEVQCQELRNLHAAVETRVVEVEKPVYIQHTVRVEVPADAPAGHEGPSEVARLRSRLAQMQVRLDAASWRLASLERSASQCANGQAPVVAGFDYQTMALSSLVAEQTLVIDDLMKRLSALLHSRSWRVSAPLRSALRLLSGRPRSFMETLPSIAHLGKIRVADQPKLVPVVEETSPVPSERVAAGPLAWRGFYDLLYVIGCHEGESKRYRVHNYASVLGHAGYRVLTLLDCECADVVASEIQARALVLFRCGWDDRIAALVSYAKARAIPVVFDIDDLVFEPESTHLVRIVSSLDQAARSDYRRGVERYRKTLEHSDFATCTTEYLAGRVRQLGLPAYVIPNTLNLSQIEQAEALRLARASSGAGVRIGYFSGSNTHQVDFRACEDALLEVLSRHPEANFILVGILDLSERWASFEHRIERHPMLSPPQYLQVLAGIDINLAPLEIGNPYCESKSQLKIFEAAIVGVPTVASAVSGYAEAIDHGADGFLAAESAGWLEALDRLVSDSALRTRLGSAAFERATRQFSPAAGARIAEQVFHLSAPAPAAAGLLPLAETAGPSPRKLRIAWAIPNLIIGGGGHRNILRAAYHLERFGHTLDLYFTHFEGSEEELASQVREHFYPLQCSMRRWADNIEPCDVLFATHWSTVEVALRARHVAGEVMYFVQDFEPLFAPMGTEYVLAESTYRQGLYCITSGAWCERLLRREFGLDADHFVFPVDREIYHPRPRSSRRRNIIFFAKPEMHRRCYDLGIWALREVHQRRPDIEIILFGSRNIKADMLPFPATVKSLLPSIEDLAELYCNADLGIAFSTTNPSLVPYEMMACGLPVVDLDRPGNEFNYGGRTDIACLFDPTPSVMAYQICDILAKPAELAQRSRNGLDLVSTFPTEEEMARRIESLILARVSRRAQPQ